MDAETSQPRLRSYHARHIAASTNPDAHAFVVPALRQEREGRGTLANYFRAKGRASPPRQGERLLIRSTGLRNPPQSAAQIGTEKLGNVPSVHSFPSQFPL